MFPDVLFSRYILELGEIRTFVDVFSSRSITEMILIDWLGCGI